uniref:Uncharacterized protein n=1 Tax=Helianthus annuus TaxID=4232 RepID=A0A251TBB4_HELAN
MLLIKEVIQKKLTHQNVGIVSCFSLTNHEHTTLGAISIIVTSIVASVVVSIVVPVSLGIVLVLVQLGAVPLKVALSATLKASIIALLMLLLVVLRSLLLLLAILIHRTWAPAILCFMTQLVTPLTTTLVALAAVVQITSIALRVISLVPTLTLISR